MNSAGQSFVRAFRSATTYDHPILGEEHGEVEYDITRAAWLARGHSLPAGDDANACAADLRESGKFLARPLGSDKTHCMRKVVVYELLSLDGVAENCQDFITEWDDVMDSNLAAVIETQDVVILGRRSYDEWAEYWSQSDVQPFATFINSVPKNIATSRPFEAKWANSSVIDGDLISFVRDLKDQKGGDIGVHASITLAQTLLTAGLVDELKLVVGPLIHSVGRRLLDGLPPIKLNLTNSVTSPTGHLLLHYDVVDKS